MDIRKNDSGFTLLEILVVIAIMGILAALVGPSVFQNLGRSKQITARNQIAMFASALENYRLDTSSYPTTEQGLEALFTKPTLPPIPQYWNGPYLLSSPPKDPWGAPYLYRNPGIKNPQGYDVYSLGADGQPGGEGENADTGNWD